MNAVGANGAAYLYLALAAAAAEPAAGRADLGAVLEDLGLRADGETVSALEAVVARLRAGGAAPGPELTLRAARVPHPDPPATPEGWYVYAVCEEDGGEDPEWRGIAGTPVRAVHSGGIVALGHLCAARPYASTQEAEGLAWVRAHDGVVEAALGRYPAVVPLRFNTILHADGLPAARAASSWLQEQADALLGALARVRGCAEYEVRFHWAAPPAAAAAEPASGGAQGAGTAFLRRAQQVAAGGDAEALAERCLAGLRAWTREVEVSGGARDARTLLRCACLVAREGTAAFTDGLEALGAAHGLEVEATGPWPAYSFAG